MPWYTDELQLRSLSHTCRSLRAYALPLLWSVVQLATVRELGKLRDILRAAPHLAEYIRYFSFRWNMAYKEVDKCKRYPPEEGSLLDLAFLDRKVLWERTKGDRQVYDDKHGYSSMIDGCDLPYFYLRDGDVNNTFRQPSGSGPDEKGPDLRIRSSQDFDDCCVEIVNQLSSLQNFRWACEVTSMSLGVFEAL